MKVEPSALLAGPRGRRLCLDIAGVAIDGASPQAAQEYRLAVGYAAYDLDPGRGTSRVMLGSGAGEPVTPHPSPADVARPLEVLPLVDPDDGTLLRAPATAVDFARYWQEPDGEDVLAAAPEMREALGKPPRSTRPVERHMVVDAARRADSDHAQPRRARAGRTTTRRVSISPDATVYEVDGPEAWAELCRRYPLEVPASRRHDWCRATGRDTAWAIPDRPRVAADFDAVDVTVLGYLTTAGRAVAVTENTHTVLAGWNPDETYWLTDSTAPASIEQHWRRNADDGAWTRSES